MANSRYAIYRYTLSDENGDPLPAWDHRSTFMEVKGIKAAYRVRDPETHDFKNFIFDIVEGSVEGIDYFSFGVGYRIVERVEHRMDPGTEKLEMVTRDADHMRATRGVFVPSLGVSAFRDGSGEALSANGGAGRVKAVLDQSPNGYIDFAVTATQSDVGLAMRRLRLVEVKFDVRPFNPHPTNPGTLLHELMSKAKVGKMKATAQPHEGGRMLVDDGGLVSEAEGLANKGYGQLGIKAKASDGSLVTYKKKSMSGDKEKDKFDPDSAAQLYVAVERSEADTQEEKSIVAALRELFG